MYLSSAYNYTNVSEYDKSIYVMELFKQLHVK
jgi:hypothetical protein